VWARLLSRNRRNLERVLRLDSQQHEQAGLPSTLLYEEGGAGEFENRVTVAAAGEEEEEWQLFDVSWNDIAEAVWNKQSDLFAPTSPDNPYLEREIGDPADLADVTLQREVEGGAIRDNSSGSGDPSTTRTASTTSASRASGDSSGRHESTDDDNSDESTQDEKTKKRKAKKQGGGGPGRGTTKKAPVKRSRNR